MPKLPNPNRIKTHWVYDTSEAATALEVDRRTILRWIKTNQLKACKAGRSWLIRGANLKWFLERRRADAKSKLSVGEFFCLRCKAPRRPAADLADFQKIDDCTGRLTALCGCCYGVMNRIVRTGDLPEIGKVCEVTVQRDDRRIMSETDPRSIVTSKRMESNA